MTVEQAKKAKQASKTYADTKSKRGYDTTLVGVANHFFDGILWAQENVLQPTTKMIAVKGDGDYGVLYFKRKYNEKTVAEIIQENLLCVENPTVDSFDEETDEDFTIEYFEFPSTQLSSKIKEFFHNMEDYDQAKHSSFFFEDELINF